MSHLGDSDISEKKRVLGNIALTLGAMTVTSIVMNVFGLSWYWQVIERLPFWSGLAVCAGLWAGTMLAMVYAPRALMALPDAIARHGLVGLCAVGGSLAACRRRVGIVLSAALKLSAPLVPIFEPFYIGILMIAQPLLAPFAPLFALFRVAGLLAWRAVVAPLLRCGGQFREFCSAEWMLWRAYRTEFRAHFTSYAEFRRAFGSGGGERQQGPPPADPFVAACKVMGLPEDGAFSESEFKARSHEDVSSGCCRAE